MVDEYFAKKVIICFVIIKSEVKPCFAFDFILYKSVALSLCFHLK